MVDTTHLISSADAPTSSPATRNLEKAMGLDSRVGLRGVHAALNTGLEGVPHHPHAGGDQPNPAVASHEPHLLERKIAIGLPAGYRQSLRAWGSALPQATPDNRVAMPTLDHAGTGQTPTGKIMKGTFTIKP